MERMCSRFLRTWLGVPPSFSSVNLYGMSAAVSVPVTSVTEEYKVAKVKTMVTLENSQDQVVQNAGIAFKCGRKWSSQKEVKEAKEALRMEEIVGITCRGRLGLDHNHEKYWSKATERERRDLIVQQVRKIQEQERCTKAVGLTYQGAWMNWKAVIKRKVIWSDI